MKSIRRIAYLKLAVLALVGSQVFAATSAVAAGYKLADKTGASIAELMEEIVNVKKQVDTSMLALGRIVTDASADPRAAFKQFDKSVPKVDAAAKKAKKRAEDIQARGKQYFDQWEKEMAAVNNPEVQRLAQERKAKLQGTFDAIRTSMQPARDQFTVWVVDLQDLQKYLSNDLTVAGIDAAKDLIAKTTKEGQAVQQTLDKVISELNTVVATLTPAKKPAKKK